MKELPKLAEEVNVVRVMPEGEVIDCVGTVVGLLIFDGRPQIQVKIHGEDKRVNCDVPAINCTEEEKQAYVDHVKKIRSHSDTVNEALKEKVKAGNDEIERMNSEFMGPKIL